MSAYKERKLGAFRQLECVFYGLDDLTEKLDAQAVDEQLRKKDNVKSEVNLNPFLYITLDYYFRCLLFF